MRPATKKTHQSKTSDSHSSQKKALKIREKAQYYLLLFAFLILMALSLFLFRDFLNANSNSLMVLITFVYVVATVEICRANIRSADATREQLAESKRQFEETKRLEHMPYMQVSFGDWIPRDKRSGLLPEMWLMLSRSNCKRDVSSGMSINVANIGLGLAVNIRCRWIAPDIKEEKHLSSTLLKQDECCTTTIMITAVAPDKEPQYADGSLVICFDDFLGNHYEQTIEINFQVYPQHIVLVHYTTKTPVHTVGNAEEIASKKTTSITAADWGPEGPFRGDI